MALGLNTSTDSGSFLGICKYDARAGRLFRVDRTQGPDGAWTSNSVDITSPAPQFAIDFGSIEIGWLAFSATGPSFALAPFGSPMPAKPTPDHKNGFRAKIGGKVVGGVKELAASSKCVLGAIDELHSIYEAAPEAAAGKIPLVKLSGTRAVVSKGPQGTTTNYAPVFEVTGWVDRLPEMGERTVPLPNATAAPAPQRPAASAPPPANHAPPPVLTTAAPTPAPTPTGMPQFAEKELATADDDMPF